MLAQLIMEVRAILEERFQRLKKRAIALMAAALLFGFAFLFGLFALFIALQAEVGPAAAALILFLVLAAAGAAALMWGRERQKRQRGSETRTITEEPRATYAVTPPSRLTSSGWPLLFTAFAAGLALSRTRFNQWRRDKR